MPGCARGAGVVLAFRYLSHETVRAACHNQALQVAIETIAEEHMKLTTHLHENERVSISVHFDLGLKSAGGQEDAFVMDEPCSDTAQAQC